MSDTIFYDTLYNQEDARWNNNNTYDLTSIVDALECGNVDKIIGNVPDISLNLYEDLNKLDNWLLKTLHPALFHVKFNDSHKKFVSKLILIQKHLNQIFSTLIQNNKKLNQSNNDYTFNNFCVVCSKRIKINDCDFLSQIENHEHVMQIMNDKKIINDIKKKQKESRHSQKLRERQNKTNVQDNQRDSNGEPQSSRIDCREPSTSKEHRDSSKVQLLEGAAKDLNKQDEKYLKQKQEFQDLLKKMNDVRVDDSANYVVDNDESSETMSTSSSGCRKYTESSTSSSTTSSPKDVASFLYPLDVIQEILEAQQSDLLTVQQIKQNVYRCLLCNKDFQLRDITSHVHSSLHLHKLQTNFSSANVRRYHEYFSKLPRFLSIHQICFFPMSITCFRCKVCNCGVGHTNLLEHINGFRHRQFLLDKPVLHSLFFYDEIIRTVRDGSIDNYIKNHRATRSNNVDNLQPQSSTTAPKKEPVKPQHLIILSLAENPATIFDHIEKRLQVHKKFMTVNDDKFFCSVCNITMDIHEEILKTHFISQTHLRNARKEIPKYNWTYKCDLCPKMEKTEIKWFEHLSSVIHKQRLDSIRKSGIPLKGGEFKEYECRACLTVIFGNNFTLARHVAEVVSKKKKREVKLPIQVVKLFKDSNALDEKIMKMIKESDKTVELSNLHSQCCRAIEKVLQRLFPACHAWPFGSRVSGIGCLDSDLDIFVDTGMMYDGMIYQDDESQATLVRQVTKELRRYSEFVDINPIPNARTPIIQVYHRVTGLDCDLSFRHGLSVENTEFLRLCIDVQPVVQPLILIIKYWLHQCDFDKISTYAMAMMAIFFMQTKNYLPTVKMIREIDPTPCKVIAGWQTFRYTKPLEEIYKRISQCDLNPRELLKDFFDYYSKFNYEKDVVCPLIGRLILKENFNEDDGLKLPPEMLTYVQKIKMSDKAERFRHLSPMCIQDPFDLSHNLTKACPLDYVNRFQQFCLLSYQILTDQYPASET